jgi:hypothetical protein
VPPDARAKEVGCWPCTVTLQFADGEGKCSGRTETEATRVKNPESYRANHNWQFRGRIKNEALVEGWSLWEWRLKAVHKQVSIH